MHETFNPNSLKRHDTLLLLAGNHLRLELVVHHTALNRFTEHRRIFGILRLGQGQSLEGEIRFGNVAFRHSHIEMLQEIQLGALSQAGLVLLEPITPMECHHNGVLLFGHTK